MNPLPVLPDFALVANDPSPFLFRIFAIALPLHRYALGLSAIQTGRPGRGETFPHMPSVTPFLALLSVLPTLLVPIVSASTATAPSRTFPVDASRLLETELGLFELHQLGDETDVWRNPFPPFCNVGVCRLECPGIGVDEISENNSDRA